MLKNAFLLLLPALPLLAQAQSPDPFSKAEPRAELRLSYVGSILYPGLKAGVALPVRQFTVSKREGRKWLLKDRHIVLNLGGYHHPAFHDNLYLTAEWQMRRTRSSGWFTEFSPGLGYSRTFLGGTTYAVADDGTVSIKRAAGYDYALVTLGAGVGYAFSVRDTRPVTTFFRLSLLTLAPYNSFLYVRPTAEVGLTVRLRSWRASQHQKPSFDE